MAGAALAEAALAEADCPPKDEEGPGSGLLYMYVCVGCGGTREGRMVWKQPRNSICIYFVVGDFSLSS